MGMLPPVVATLVADTKEYSAKMAEAQGQMEEFAGASDAAGAKFTKFGNVLSDAVLGAAGAVAAFSLDEGYKFQESMDQMQNATGMTTKQIKALEATIFSISNVTGASTADLATSLTAIEQAGIHGAKATDLLNVAAKAALATNTNVTAVTQSLVAVQALHLKGTKDLSAATGVLVAGSHNFVGGLQAEVAMLQGKVGSAFSEYGFSLKQAIEYGSIFSKVGLPTRSIATLATGLGKILDPIHTVTDSNGKLEHGLSSTYLAITQLGLKYSKVAADVKQGNLAGLLLYLKDVAAQTNEPLTVLLNTVLGSSGGIAGSLILKNLSAVKDVQKGISGAGSNSLNTAFTTASDQFGNKMHIIENELKNSAAEFGLKLLPYLSDAATFFENALTGLEKHPMEQKALELDVGVTVAAALGVKIASAMQSSIQTALLKQIAGNTTKIAVEGGGADVEGGAGDAELLGVGGMSVASKFGAGVTVFAAGVASFEITSDLLKTAIGKKVGDFITKGGDYNPINDAASALATILGKRIEQSTKATKNDTFAGTKLYDEELAAIKAGNTDLAQKLYNELEAKGNKKPGRVTINHTTKVGFSK